MSHKLTHAVRRRSHHAAAREVELFIFSVQVGFSPFKCAVAEKVIFFFLFLETEGLYIQFQKSYLMKPS